MNFTRHEHTSGRVSSGVCAILGSGCPTTTRRKCCPGVLVPYAARRDRGSSRRRCAGRSPTPGSIRVTCREPVTAAGSRAPTCSRRRGRVRRRADVVEPFSAIRRTTAARRELLAGHHPTRTRRGRVRLRSSGSRSACAGASPTSRSWPAPSSTHCANSRGATRRATVVGPSCIRAVHLGIAVDLAFEGLIVPVVHDAEGKRLGALAAVFADLADRARTRRLRPDEVAGGTFTITNPGAFGTWLSLPIINHPQVAILATDGVRKRVVVGRTTRRIRCADHPSGRDALVELRPPACRRRVRGGVRATGRRAPSRRATGRPSSRPVAGRRGARRRGG